MSCETTRFLIFSLFGFFSLCGGYLARRCRCIQEDRSRQIHWVTVVIVWPLAMLINLWRIPPRVENLWLLIIQPVLMAATAYGVIPLARWLRCSRRETGVMVLGAGLSNNGFTLGAYLCYSLLKPPEEALAYGLAFVSVQVTSMVLLIYPVVMHYSHDVSGDQKRQSLLRLILSSYFNVRAAALYAALLGVTLAVMRVEVPQVIDRWHLVTVLFYAGAFGGYFGIGLRLRPADASMYWKPIALLAGIKFVAAPLLALVLLRIINSTPWPLNAVACDVTQIESMMPAGIIMVMLANLFHLDTRMASVLWVWSTAIFLTVPLGLILWWY